MRLPIACTLLLVGGPLLAADRFDPVRETIRAHLTGGQMPSVAVAAAKGDSILWEEGFGWANREKSIPANAHTMYSLASISKPLTATALMTLAKAGRIDLEKPLNDYLGMAKLQARVGDARDATVRRVANHSAGLPEHYQFFYVNEPWRVPSPDETILHYGQLFNSPGEHYEYSNLGYGILSYVIARVSGMAFADYMRKSVFLPLGMTRSTVGNDSTFADCKAVRYGSDGRPIPLYETDHEGASGMWASAHDLVRFGMFNLKVHFDNQAAILPDTLIDEMHKPTISEGNGDRYGVGWETRVRGGYTLLEHTGEMPGVASVLRTVPSEGAVVVVLCNAEDFEFADSLANQMLSALLAHSFTPEKDPDGPPQMFVPPADLIAKWTGKISTPDADLPVTLTVLPSGEVRMKLADQWETLVHHPFLTDDGYFRGMTTGDLGIRDGVRRPYRVGLRLKLRDGSRLTGEVTARADQPNVTASNGLFPSVNGQPAPDNVQARGFVLAHWAELTKP